MQNSMNLNYEINIRANTLDTTESVVLTSNFEDDLSERVNSRSKDVKSGK